MQSETGSNGARLLSGRVRTGVGVCVDGSVRACVWAPNRSNSRFFVK